MDFVIGMGFVLCLLYLFYERENRPKPRMQAARARSSRGSSTKGRRTTRRRSRYKLETESLF